jgi:hypothetical protein
VDSEILSETEAEQARSLAFESSFLAG